VKATSVRGVKAGDGAGRVLTALLMNCFSTFPNVKAIACLQEGKWLLRSSTPFLPINSLKLFNILLHLTLIYCRWKSVFSNLITSRI
jgi:hypothetical protein